MCVIGDGRQGASVSVVQSVSAVQSASMGQCYDFP